MLFATPDFGAGGAILLVLLVIWFLVIGGVLFGMVKAIKLLRRGSTGSTVRGAVLLSCCVLLPLSCYVSPRYLVRVVYGNYPLGHYPQGVVREGMTRDEVRGLLGSPHQSYSRDGEESWFYYLDSFGMSWFGVFFGPDDRVKSTAGS